VTHRIEIGIAALVLWIGASFAFAATLRMESRAAPSEEEKPRVHAPDARWLADVPVAGSIRLSQPSESERVARARDGIRDPAGFGRSIEGARAKLIVPRDRSALRFSIVSPGALHVRTALKFSDAAQYRITAYRPGDESDAVSLYRKPSAAAEPQATVWTAVTDGDTQVVVVERIGEAASEWSVDVPRISHFDRSIYQAEVGPELNLGSSAPCQVDMACVYQVARTIRVPSSLPRITASTAKRPSPLSQRSGSTIGPPAAAVWRIPERSKSPVAPRACSAVRHSTPHSCS
jgi:hypothetical protein